jgi:hypothetical protein
MSRRYRVGHTPKRRGRKLVAVFLISFIVFAAIVGFVVWDMSKNDLEGEVEGASRSVAQQADLDEAAGSQKHK